MPEFFPTLGTGVAGVGSGTPPKGWPWRARCCWSNMRCCCSLFSLQREIAGISTAGNVNSSFAGFGVSILAAGFASVFGVSPLAAGYASVFCVSPMAGTFASVFGASAFSTLGNFLWLKHPLVPHRPMIAYDAVVVLLPATLLGSTAGVFLNKVCPNWLIMLLLVSLCAFSGRRTLEQAPIEELHRVVGTAG